MTMEPEDISTPDTHETSVRFFRLVTGEDLIAENIEVKTEDEYYFVLYNPMKLVYMMGNKPGTLGVTMMQWVFSNVCDDQQFVLYPQDIIVTGSPAQHMIEGYSRTVAHCQQMNEETIETFENGNEMEEALAQYDAPLTANTKLEKVQRDYKRKLH